jgi:Peptidase of plants and bacteria
MSHSHSVRIICLAFATSIAGQLDAQTDRPTVAATIETTLTTDSHQLRQFAFDGDDSTYFLSALHPGTADRFTLVFDEPVVVKTITAVTGRPDGSNALESGRLDTSTDGTTFTNRAHFTGGSAYAIPGTVPIRAVRITTTKSLTRRLAIREIKIDSQPPLAVFRYPVEFIVDTADAPEMKEWAEEAARACERSYPMINDELQSDGYKPRTEVKLSLKTSYRGVAGASDGEIVGSVRYFKSHPDDIGAMIHETTHIVQNYKHGDNPGWLVEGISDYLRFFKYEPGKLGRINAARAHYNDAYRTSAAFLAFVGEKYDKQLVKKLNALMREGKYSDEAFERLTGKNLEQLDNEWRLTLHN